VLSSDSVSGDIATFRLLTLAVAVTAALAVVSSMFIHRFVQTQILPALRESVIEAA
jgi:hypothetical protein